MAILVPLLFVLGLMFLAWGAFRLMWDTRWDKAIRCDHAGRVCYFHFGRCRWIVRDDSLSQQPNLTHAALGSLVVAADVACGTAMGDDGYLSTV